MAPHPGTPRLLRPLPAQGSHSGEGCGQGHVPGPPALWTAWASKGDAGRQPDVCHVGLCALGCWLQVGPPALSPFLSWVSTIEMSLPAQLRQAVLAPQGVFNLPGREAEELLQPTRPGSATAPRAAPRSAALPRPTLVQRGEDMRKVMLGNAALAWLETSTRERVSFALAALPWGGRRGDPGPWCCTLPSALPRVLPALLSLCECLLPAPGFYAAGTLRRGAWLLGWWQKKRYSPETAVPAAWHCRLQSREGAGLWLRAGTGLSRS